MGAREYSEYQRQIIKNYYKNLDTIMLQRLETLVGDLYLAGSEARRKQLWDRARKAMVKLEIPVPIINHIIKSKDPAVLAKNLQHWLKASEEKSSNSR